MKTPLILALCVAAAGLAQAQLMNDRETVINTSTVLWQEEGSAARLIDGGLVIAFTDHSRPADDPSARAVRAQILNADGTPRGGEFLVNSVTEGAQSDPRIAALSDGGFVVTYHDTSKTPPDTSFGAVRARLFDADGTPRGPDFLVNTSHDRDQDLPDVAGFACGGFLIAWEDRSATAPDTSGSAIRYRVFDNAGTPLADDFIANQVTTGWQFAPVVAPVGACDAVIIWMDDSLSVQPGGRVRLSGRLYNNASQSVSGEFEINDIGRVEGVLRPTVTPLPSGGFAVAWEDPGQGGPDPCANPVPGSAAIRARLFDAAGQPRGAAVNVSRQPGGRRVLTPRIAPLAHDGFAVVWRELDPVDQGLLDMIGLQFMDSGGNYAGDRIVYDPRVSDILREPGLVALADDRLLLTWGDFGHSGPDDDASSIRAIRLSSPGLDPADLRAAALPSARSGTTAGGAITAYFSVAATQAGPAQSCQLSAPAGAPLTLVSRGVDATNSPVGPYDPVFDLAAGGFASFVLFMTPTATTDADGYAFVPSVTCANGTIDAFAGTNSVRLTIADTAGPDLLSIGATPSQDGVIRIAAVGGAGVLSLAAVNIGAGDGSAGAGEATITVTAHTGGTALPVSIELCETDPATSQCLSPRAASQTAVFGGTTPRTFAAFVRDTGTGGIAFRPADHRIWIDFHDANGVLRSSTSAAITAPAGN